MADELARSIGVMLALTLVRVVTYVSTPASLLLWAISFDTKWLPWAAGTFALLVASTWLFRILAAAPAAVEEKP